MQTISAQSGNLQQNTFQKVAPQMNSQGEVIEPQQQEQQELRQEEIKPQELASEQQSKQQLPQKEELIEEDFYELGDTALAPSADDLMPPTDDTGLVHEIISCGHVLKSTHDLARWSEKTGARRVNTQESIDAISDLAVNLEPNRGGNRRRANNGNQNQGGDPAADIQGLFGERGAGGKRSGRQNWKPVQGSNQKSEVIQCWPVLKSTHDQAQLSEKRGKNSVNKSASALDELALNQGAQSQESNQAQQASLEGVKQMFAGGQELNQASSQPAGESQILHSWPVLKSTHDAATLSEKRGANAVNQAGSGETLEEVAQNGLQAGGSSLQSGMDTQAGSHMQMDNQQGLTETPEKVMEDLHVHV